MPLTEEQLFADCPPRRPLDKIISQYYPEIRDLQAYRDRKTLEYRHPSGSDQLRTLAKGRLVGKQIATFTPFELISRAPIEILERREDAEGKMEFAYWQQSRPIHLKNGEQIVVKTTETILEPRIEIASQPRPTTTYDIDAETVARARASDLEHQDATYEDMIFINRRLIGENIRCMRCKDGEQIKCFRFDWLRKRLL